LVEGLRKGQNGCRHCALLWSSKNGQEVTQEGQTAAPIKGDRRATARGKATVRGIATVRGRATYFRIRTDAVKEAMLLQLNLCSR